MMDSRFAAALNILPTLKSQAIKYTMADGKTSAGGIVTLIKVGPHQESLTFDITKLYSYPIMLGIPWLKRHRVSWSPNIPMTPSPPAARLPPVPSTKSVPKVSLINAVAFHHCLKMPDI